MQQVDNSARVAALRELAGRLYRNIETRDGRTYWKDNAPRNLRTWVMDVHRQSPYMRSDLHELHRVLYTLCGLVLDRTDGPGQVTAREIADAIARNEWADPADADLLRWMQDDASRIALVDQHLEAGSVLAAARTAQHRFRGNMAYTLLAALERRAAGELAVWDGA